jgi:flagellar biosynthetic protein FliR
MEALAEILTAAEASLLTAAGVFTRIAAAAFLIPGMGERAVPTQVRLGLALALTLLLWPMVAPLVPQTPETVPGLVRLLGAEAANGLLIGLAFRLLVIVLQIAGMTAAFHLSISHMFGSGVAPTPEPTIATFLALGGIVLAMQAGLHVAVVAALAGLYGVLPFGQFPLSPDAAAWGTERMAQAFAFGLSLAFPFVLVSFAYNLALGALSRAMPQLLVALVGVPLLIGLGLVTLWLTLPAIYARWGSALGDILADPLGSLG